ncbi:hypothetical protein A2331_06835 [Candidatus Falkowbacteria bacterium RIFOXYB2_FULL_34_18]|uniref:Uncharacterized protein n=1 Tax=Candidatus Falkowbacteria bacterium RIFOXYD2_FULL_34_120 TaxID=1798007 RepID=A0A1F5TRV0_9BACT|nr:MAG: hypothetical protein A2331_06835 [Candidatus Falkowbacteria bacterium RIFOXYB2_FULL_34_18]OGF29964.1 MAG: hypothetical protein A2500_03845 [Candidatus Falkowbacteria bacterium RIFOXYC12_FULL_34_55]OGF37179.1 MAG: hypothetical protein A2466_02675 [Candidatus Falkowbacteria bacterium RIFOXYC2_FULL_34_220]OGF39500.1 MAG: hypothetical protein A2515_04210 [Candidatus Falkowbacteria bacterium RIFOXYD12_FULL_34_57]OGF41517.1 MAG: hypothetical protein A2531_02390 [Candidatus Falkowbacteria bact
MTTSIFIDISVILGIAIGIAFLVQLLKQPMIISYIITGIICGPVFLNLINSNQEFFDVFANFGVILLLFLVGLSLNIGYLKRIGKVAAITGIGQVIFTSLFGFFILFAIGFDKYPAIFLAISITFSSTIIIMKLLSDKKDLQTVYGRYTVGLMLVQDIIAIVIMIMLPIFQNSDSILATVFVLFVKVFLFLLAVYLLANLILPVILNRAARSGEFLLMFTLAWCFAIAGFGEMAGISLEVGAILAGLALGSSRYQMEISSRVRPIRDFFIALFFIILGSEMYIENFQTIILPGIILSIFVLVGNPLILYLLYRRMKFTRQSSFLAGLTAAQVSEFGFVFLFVAKQFGFIDDNILSIFTVVALITIFVSSYLITYNTQVYDFILPFFRIFGRDKFHSPKEENIVYDVFVFGYHRLGWKICEALKEMNVSFVVVDSDPLATDKLESRGIPYYFGDAMDVEFLSELPINKAKLIISTLPGADSQSTLIKHIRIENEKTLIIANLSHIKFLDDLYGAGADYVMMPHLISGHWMANILKTQNWNKDTFRKLYEEQKEEMRLRFTLGHH